MSGTGSLPVVLGPAGAVPTPPATLLQNLLTLVGQLNPQATLNLPGTLIEDIASTDTGALILLDGGLVELINSITPLGANAFLLSQIGQQIGIPIGLNSNTSVFVVFTGTPGFVIDEGFIVGDGTFQYVVQDGGVVGSDRQTPLLFALATQTGTWAVPAGTVTQMVTSVPNNFPLTVVNPTPGTPGTGAEDETAYRARVLQGQLAPSIGTLSFLKTLLGQVPNVQQRLISALITESGKWEVIVGGGDPYQVAYAIYKALGPGIADMTGSTLGVTDITKANPGVVTTDLNHLFSPGQVVTITHDNPSDYDGTFTIIATPTQTTFSLGTPFAAVNLSALTWASTAGGEITGTTASAHGIMVGSTFEISGASPSGYNGTYVAIAGTSGSTVVAAQTTTLTSPATTPGSIPAGVANFNTSSFGDYAGGGVVTPNLRNVPVTIIDYPDTYLVPIVNPPQQTVTMTATWNTSSTNVVSPTAMAQAAAPALAAYVNSVPVGQPLNLLQMEDAFQAAVADILPAYQLTRLVFSVSINGEGASPSAGTVVISGDPESFFFALTSGISVVQG
jgi:hypothetical protein